MENQSSTGQSEQVKRLSELNVRSESGMAGSAGSTEQAQSLTNEPKQDGPKKRGPKPGSKNIPKLDAVPQPRKSPSGIIDRKAAAERRLSEARILLEEYDREHNTGMARGLPTWDNLQQGKHPERKPQIDGGVAAAMLGIVFNLAGEMMEVEARPDPASLKAAGASIEELSKHMPIMSPLATAASAAVVSVGLCAMPMVMEYKQVKSGALLPASERKGMKNEQA